MKAPFRADEIVPALHQEVLRQIRYTSIDRHGVPMSTFYPYGLTDAELSTAVEIGPTKCPFCFMVPTKLETPDHLRILLRCIESIRHFHPTTPVVIALAKGSTLTHTFDEHTQVVENPHFATWGCLYLFHHHHYANQAFVIHDSVVLTRPVEPVDRFQFVYHFNEASLDRPRNDEGYARLLPADDYQPMLSNTKTGCFGNMMVLDHDLVETLEFLDYIPKIKTKYDFECMERITPYLAGKHGYANTISMCGDIFHPVADPWAHTEYANFTFAEAMSINFPAVFLKAIIARK